MAPQSEVHTPRRVEVLGVPVDVVGTAGAVAFADDAVQNGLRGSCVLSVNPEIVVTLAKDPSLRSFFRGGALLIPDGIGVVWAVRFLRRTGMVRVAGADQSASALRAGCAEGLSHLPSRRARGGQRRAAQQLQCTYPGLRIAGALNGYLSPEEMRGAVDEINASGAKILFVALGTPAQERWIAEHLPRLDVSVIQTVGGTLDTIAGRVKRAPRAWQKMNIEWLYRLLRDPRRIRRQSALPVFAWRVLMAATTNRSAGPSAKASLE